MMMLPLIGSSQNILEEYIPIPPQELSVEQYLFHIEEMSGIPLAYSTAIIEDKTLALFADSMQLKDLLDTLFTIRDIKYILSDDQLFLSPQKKILQEQNQLRLYGQVVNSKNGKPIPFANVFIPGQSSGTITNYEGNFEMLIPIEPMPDSLVVSCMGYTGLTILPLDFLRGSVLAELKPYRFQIDELIVRPKDPLQLIRGVLANKSTNYSNESVMFTAFFREVAKQNDKYISLSEAIVDIYKTPYMNIGNDLVKLRKGRRGSNTESSELVNFIVEGGLYNNLQLDVMKYGVNFLDPDFFDRYQYRFERQINYNERQTYILDFQQKEETDFLGFDGKLYIDVQSLALVRAEFRFNEESLDYAKSMLIRKAPRIYHIRPKHGKYVVEYRLYDETWNLNHARSDLLVRLRKRKQHRKSGFSCNFSATSEFVITGRTDRDFEKIRYRDAAKPRDILYEQVGNSDPAFWGYETTIIPEEPLTETIRKLKLEEAIADDKYVSTSSGSEN